MKWGRSLASFTATGPSAFSHLTSVVAVYNHLQRPILPEQLATTIQPIVEA